MCFAGWGEKNKTDVGDYLEERRMTHDGKGIAQEWQQDRDLSESGDMLSELCYRAQELL